MKFFIQLGKFFKSSFDLSIFLFFKKPLLRKSVEKLFGGKNLKLTTNKIIRIVWKIRGSKIIMKK
jgi:hypothetical protein